MSTHVEPILTFVRRRLDESRGEWVEISRVSGVPYHTLTKIAQGATPNPRIETVQRLVDHFNGQQIDAEAACRGFPVERMVMRLQRKARK